MSYFLAGRFQFTHPLTRAERDRAAFLISEGALRNHVAVQLGCNIVQSIVFKILGKELAADNELIFLLTDSPISDTSDELIDYLGESREDMIEVVRAHGKRLTEFLTSLRSVESLSRVSLVVSEGYDTAYRSEEADLTRLTNRLVELAAEADWLGFPSVELSIRLARE
jgi:hypothetical protein